MTVTNSPRTCRLIELARIVDLLNDKWITLEEARIMRERVELNTKNGIQRLLDMLEAE